MWRHYQNIYNCLYGIKMSRSCHTKSYSVQVGYYVIEIETNYGCAITRVAEHTQKTLREGPTTLNIIASGMCQQKLVFGVPLQEMCT